MDQSRWETLSLAAQVGNIGSELSRAMYWEGENDAETTKESLARALELIDCTIEDLRWRHRLKEIVRLRELTAAQFCSDHTFDVSLKELVDYCLIFAIFERNEQWRLKQLSGQKTPSD